MKMGRRGLGVSLLVVVSVALLGILVFGDSGSDVVGGDRPRSGSVKAGVSRIIELDGGDKDGKGFHERTAGLIERESLGAPKSVLGSQLIEIVGRVVNSAGEGLGNAQFRFLDTVPSWDYIAEESEWPRSLKTGDFSMRVRQADLRACLLVWTGPNYELKAMELPAVSRGQICLGNIVLEATAFIEGKLVDSLGVGVSGAVVSYSLGVAQRPEDSIPRLRDSLLQDDLGEESGILQDFKSCVSSEEDGSFIIPHLTGGRWALSVSHGDFCSIQGLEVEVVRSHKTKVFLALEQSFKLTFRTQDSAGNDIEGVRVRLSAVHRNFFARNNEAVLERVTDHEGLGQFDSCRFSPVRLTVEKSGFVSFSVELKLDDQKTAVQVLTLYRGSVVRGRVFSTSKDQRYLDTKIVFLWRGDPRLRCGAVLEGSNQFESKPLIPGRYRVLVAAKNHSVKVIDIELKERGGVYDLGSITLEPLTSVELRVVDENNEPLEGVFVGATNQGFLDFSKGGQKSALPTDKDGRTRLEKVSPGIVSFYALKAGCLTGYLDAVTISRGGGEETIRMTRVGGSIEGRSWNDSGELMKGGTVYLLRKGHEHVHASVRVNRDGSFLFTQVPEGIYKLLGDLGNSEALLRDPSDWVLIRRGKRTRKDLYQRP